MEGPFLSKKMKERAFFMPSFPDAAVWERRGGTVIVFFVYMTSAHVQIGWSLQ